MNNCVSFKLAKLCNEKGFKINVRPMYYFKESIQTGSYMYSKEGKLELCMMPLVSLKAGWIDAPTISEVVMWLYEKYEIWIACVILEDSPQFLSKIFIMNDLLESKNVGSFSSLLKAYEAAIEYILNNLI